MDDKSTKFEKVKRHLKDNKKVYLAGAGGVVVGGVAAFFATGGTVTIVDGVKFVHIQYKSPNINIALVRNACPDPIPVLDKLTGEAYSSITRAMKVTGETMGKISKDIHGDQVRWERLPNSVFA